MLRVLLSLGLVLAALWIAARGARRWGTGGLRLQGRTTRPGLIEARVGLSRTAGLTVVRFGDRRFLVAANERTVKVLAEEVVTDEAPLDAPAAPLRDALAPVLTAVARLNARRQGTADVAAAPAAKKFEPKTVEPKPVEPKTVEPKSFKEVLDDLDTSSPVAGMAEQASQNAAAAEADQDKTGKDPVAAAVEASLKPASLLETLRVVTARYEA